MPLRIVTDSTADLEAEETAALGVAVVPLSVIFGETAYLDRVELRPEEFYRRLRQDQAVPKTSQPSAGRFEEVYAGLAAAGATEILSIHLSASLSGTVGAAELAARRLPATCRVTVLDSRTIAGGLAALVRTAATIAGAGGPAAAAAAAAAQMIPRQHISVLLDTLDYLQRGGRIGRARAWVGSMLNIKPIVAVQDGEVGAQERVRSRARGLDRLVARAAAFGEVERVTVQHADCAADADHLARRLRESLPGIPIDTRYIGPVIGVYVGPDAIGTIVVQRPDAVAVGR